MLLNIKQLQQKTQSHRKISVFAQISRQVKYWQQLSQLIQPLLPQPEQWQVVCYQAGVLTIAGHNQAMVSQLNYLKTQYTTTLAQLDAFKDLKSIQVTLLPLQHHATHQKEPINSLSPSSRERFALFAESIEHPALKQAFEKLAQNPEHE